MACLEACDDSLVVDLFLHLQINVVILSRIGLVGPAAIKSYIRLFRAPMVNASGFMRCVN